ncbi:hypothetical protein H6G11_01010 [Cyanobacterium aponinum FACHB-4101]|uniref:hypothetical protein n=1 Tax=Cyanobacterium aponinum TaxID=379064 RepID=UPI00168187FC|nr:hypothetical protein [Cyanobacterium aponinum]MBD2392835.1 hypothetical protein [Cyanobacterium aponinum FACHB-4101]
MIIIETKINITDEHLLNIKLPEDITVGEYEIAIIINPVTKSTTPHPINKLAGKFKAFKNINSLE